jgi:hypothetical protein
MSSQRRRRIPGLLLAATLLATALAGLTRTAAQSVCRGECDESFRACQRGCAMAQSFDNCVADCRREYDRCVDACD